MNEMIGDTASFTYLSHTWNAGQCRVGWIGCYGASIGSHSYNRQCGVSSYYRDMRDVSNDTVLFATHRGREEKNHRHGFLSGRAVSLHKTSGETT